MPILSPSIVRIEQPIHKCVRILNSLGCESIHVDVYQGLILPNFFDFNEIRSGSLHAFFGRVTMHLFRVPSFNHEIDLSFMREHDLAVLHIFPDTNTDEISRFLEAVRLAGCRPGLSLDVGIEPSIVEQFVPILDTIFVMGIPVATYGLKPDKSMLTRLANVKELIMQFNECCRLGLDGGVNSSTFTQLITLVDELVIGSLLFNTDDLVAQWKELNTITKRR